MFSVNGTIKRGIAYTAGVDKTNLSLFQACTYPALFKECSLHNTKVCIAAWLTAPVYALLLCPIEVAKARLQVRSSRVELLYCAVN
jgi:hypothetical protein